LIENLDRLSRDKIGVALSLFISILNAGVEIVTLAPERAYTQDSVNDIAGLLEPIIAMQRAWEESQVKSTRGCAKWQARRDGVYNAGRKIVFNARMLPPWIVPNADGTDFELEPEKAAVVREIFSMSAEGFSVVAIARKLESAGVTPIAAGMGKTKGKGWAPYYVGKILKNRAAIGEFQPHRVIEDKRFKIGEPVKGYFPAVVDEDMFNRVQAALRTRLPRMTGTGSRRKTTAETGKTRAVPAGSRPHSAKNLFKGILIDARDGRTLNLSDRSVKGKNYYYLINSGALRGYKDAYFCSFPYAIFEAMFLLATKELTPESLATVNGDAKAELARLNTQLAEINAAIVETKLKVQGRGKGTTVNVLLDLLVDLEQQRNEVQAALVSLQIQASSHTAATLKATQSLVEQLEACATDHEREDLRERLCGRIRALVDRIYVLVWKGNTVKHALAQIHFFNGSMRVLYLNDQWDGRTLLNPPIVPERDLRNYRENPWKLDEVAV
jgi:DNA invertase Pin-like site-specific DNA recombinase